MEKYLEVAWWYVWQHPRMFAVLGFSILAIALMYYAAWKEETAQMGRVTIITRINCSEGSSADKGGRL